MEYRYLGRSGLKVSEVCLGAMTFGREADEASSVEMMDRFADAGGNFIDTADVYSRGISEEIVGRWLSGKPRESFVVASKARFPMGAGPNEVGVSRKHLVAALDDSLRRLGTDYVDLYQVHAWDDATPLEETLATLDTMVKSGKVRYLGVSNFTGWQLQKTIETSRRHGWEVVVSLQAQYSLLTRSTEWELVPVCLREGLALMAWSPLRGGWLSGRFKRGMDAPPPGSRVVVAGQEGWEESWANYNRESTWKVIDALLSVADDEGKTPAQVALNWLLTGTPASVIPILGASKIEHLEDNLGAAGWTLPDEQARRLDAASRLEPVYPYWFLQANASDRHRSDTR